MGRSQVSDSKALPVFFGVLLLSVVVFFAGNFQAPVRAFFAHYLTGPANQDYAALSRSEIEQRLSEAEDALERVKYQSVLYGLLVEENASLRQATDVESITTAVPARVLSRPPRTHYDTLIVGAGSATGIAVHDIAVWNGILLGEVTQVSASSATVDLYSSPGSEHDVILGTPSAVAIARGVGAGAFEVEIPQGVEVTAGEVVRASTDETLIIGTVVSVSGSATDATKTVHVAVPISMNAIDFVSLIPLGDI